MAGHLDGAAPTDYKTRVLENLYANWELGWPTRECGLRHDGIYMGSGGTSPPFLTSALDGGVFSYTT